MSGGRTMSCLLAIFLFASLLALAVWLLLDEGALR
jgi:hypothetical protein